MIAPARVAALDVLQAVHGRHVDLPSALARARGRLTDDRDCALASDIATGVERHRGTLDHIIGHFAKRSIDRLDPQVLEILRMSGYQLLHLTRVPASAVVHDAVELTRKSGTSSAAGFVNAILRQISRKRNALPLPARPHDPQDRDAAIEYLTVAGSHPRWLAERWFDRLGFERAETWTRFDNEPAPLSLRANTIKLTAAALQDRLEQAGVASTAGRFAPDALLVDEGHIGDAADPADYVIQDEGSQLVTLLAGITPGPRLLDTCAAPGGKTTAFAAVVGERGHVVACEVRDRRVALLRRTLRVADATNVFVVQADATGTLPFGATFSTVIVDAPCSGLGTLRRDPDIRWRREPADLPRFAAAQIAMLRQAARVVAPGGRLVYATCSTEPEENEAVAETFLNEAHGFTPLDARLAHPAMPSEVVDAHGHLRTTPDQHGLEGFFGAVFERTRDMSYDPQPSMALRTRVWGAGKLLILAGALLATYVVFAVASMRLALRAREVPVPNLIGRTANDATAVAADQGLSIRLDDARRLDPKVPAGRVVAQDPLPQTTTRQQRTIRVWLSAGARAAVVPDLQGQADRAAQMRLAQDGLELGTVAEIRSEAFPSDLVVAQDPPAKTAGAKVALLVNRAEQSTSFVMPDLIGVNGERATTILRGHGFRVAVVGSTPYPGVGPGVILRQSPQAGFQIAPGEPISIEVSQ